MDTGTELGPRFWCVEGEVGGQGLYHRAALWFVFQGPLKVGWLLVLHTRTQLAGVGCLSPGGVGAAASTGMGVGLWPLDLPIVHGSLLFTPGAWAEGGSVVAGALLPGTRPPPTEVSRAYKCTRGGRKDGGCMVFSLGVWGL